jgi:T-complex protein 1 subunit gamma
MYPMGGMGGAPQILVLSQNTKRESGRKVQLANVGAAKAIADVIRTCLGPRAMLKMLLNPIGSIVMTNDGNAVLREITVQHPAAKSVIEISRTQDEEVGDGTTTVIILAGELLSVCQPFLEQNMHPTIIISALRQALEDMIHFLKDKVAFPVDPNDEQQMIQVIKSCIGTKIISKWGDLACKLALNAVKTVYLDEGGRKEIDIKKYAKVEKVPGGEIMDSRVLSGVMLNKDITHAKMRRRIENPRIVLLDCGIEYKKGESQTELEITKEEDFSRLLEIEEEFVQNMCADIIKLKPDVVITEKGISDLAQHYFVKANISCLRRVRKTDNNRIARACGAVIANRTDELKEEDVGTEAGLFEIQKIGDEYFCFITECKNPKACTILLRGASKDILAEVERNLQDAMNVARNVMIEPYTVPGGGAVEMAVGKLLNEKAKTMTGLNQWPYRVVAKALEVIPRTLIQNCGGEAVRTLTALRAKHATTSGDFRTWGIDGEQGTLADMKELGIWEPLAVKLQAYKTAVETAVLLLRIDDIVSGSKKRDQMDKPASQPQQPEPTEESQRE